MEGDGATRPGDGGKINGDADANAKDSALTDGADLCSGVVCNAPPGPTCKDPATLETFSASGTCSAGKCSYPSTQKTCACAAGACGSFGAASTIATTNEHTCVLTSTGPKCWGNNGYGALGDGTKTSTRAPVDASTLPGVVSIATGYYQTCGLTAAGGVKCVGNGSVTATDVAGLTSGVVALSSGQAFNCAVTSAGAAKCWGLNTDGQLGNNTKQTSPTPVDVEGLTSGVVSISAGYTSTCALTQAGGVKCWGRNNSGQIGNPSVPFLGTPVPVDVQGLTSGVAAVSVGLNHACALMTTGGVKCWGDMKITITDHPVDIAGLSSGVAAISAGQNNTCVLTSSGGVKCWGLNGSGQLGNNSSGTGSTSPVDVQGLTSGVASVAVGYNRACAVTTAGAAFCWGENAKGELGNGGNQLSRVPVAVLGLP